MEETRQQPEIEGAKRRKEDERKEGETHHTRTFVPRNYLISILPTFVRMITTQALRTLSTVLTQYIDHLTETSAKDETVSLDEFKERATAFDLCRDNLTYSIDYLIELIQETEQKKPPPR